jgi:hypothetical protein
MTPVSTQNGIEPFNCTVFALSIFLRFPGLREKVKTWNSMIEGKNIIAMRPNNPFLHLRSYRENSSDADDA